MGSFIFAIFLIAGSILMFVFGETMKMNKAVVRIGGPGVLLLGVIILIASMVVIIDAGEVGVVVIFGQAQKNYLASGVNLVPPYAQIYKYSTRIIELTEEGANSVEARAGNGLIVHLDSTTLYRIDPTQVTVIYTNIAQSLSDLQDKILLTALRTVIRDEASKFSTEEIYSTKRDELTLEIDKSLKEMVGPKGIIIDRFSIRKISLPEEVDKSIQLKISAQQEAEAMQYKKQQAEQAADIKVIEAQGLARAQQIINSTLTPYYLQHEAIQAYKDLADSKNTTFVILPTSPTSSGMPLILNAPR